MYYNFKINKYLNNKRIILNLIFENYPCLQNEIIMTELPLKVILTDSIGCYFAIKNAIESLLSEQKLNLLENIYYY